MLTYDNPPVIEPLDNTANPVATLVYVPPPYENTLAHDLYTGSSFGQSQIGQSIHSPEMHGHLRKTGFVDPASERRAM